MIHTVADFGELWTHEAELTSRVIARLTDASLSQAVTPNERTLGRIAWHLVTTLPDTMQRVHIRLTGPAAADPVPRYASAIADSYEIASTAFQHEVRKRWNDAMLGETIDIFGERWTRGFLLTATILHQAHHRGQMTVLMRQAGLTVPDVYGPARESWAQWGMPEPAV